jgi:hypothetical protein
MFMLRIKLKVAVAKIAIYSLLLFIYPRLLSTFFLTSALKKNVVQFNRCGPE